MANADLRGHITEVVPPSDRLADEIIALVRGRMRDGAARDAAESLFQALLVVNCEGVGAPKATAASRAALDVLHRGLSD